MEEARNWLFHGGAVAPDAYNAMEECRKAHGGPIDREAIIGACVQARGSEEDAETYLAAIAEERYRMAAESSIPSATTMARVRRAWENCFEVEGGNGDSAVVRLKSDVLVLGTGEIIKPGLYTLPTLPASGGDRIWTNGALNWPGTADIAVGGENPGEGPHFSVPVFEYEDWWGNYHFLTGYGVAFLAAMQELMEVGDAGAARDMWVEVYGYRANGRVAEALELMGLPPIAVKPTRRPPRTYDVRLKGHEANIDPLTQAVMGRLSNSPVKPETYWLPEGAPGVKVNTGSGGTAALRLSTTVDDMDADIDLYVLGGRECFWHDFVTTLFFNGQTEVTGAQILAACGYSNPYCEEARPRLLEALASVRKCMGTFIEIDTTGERRNARRANAKVIESITLRPVMGVEISLDTLETDAGQEARDFTLRLIGNQTNEQAFPLAAYARARKMVTFIDASEYTFKTVNPSIEARQAWHYLIRCLHAQSRSNTVLFDTMWKDLGLSPCSIGVIETGEDGKPTGRTLDKNTGEPLDERTIERRRKDAERKRRDRIIKTLEKMGAEAVANGTLKSFEFSHDKKTGKVNGFKMTPNNKSISK